MPPADAAGCFNRLFRARTRCLSSTRLNIWINILLWMQHGTEILPLVRPSPLNPPFPADAEIARFVSGNGCWTSYLGLPHSKSDDHQCHLCRRLKEFPMLGKVWALCSCIVQILFTTFCELRIESFTRAHPARSWSVTGAVRSLQ